MERGYWFKSDLFHIHKGEDEETNPGCYGKELGEWLCKKFKEKGYEAEEVIPEDWGWCVMCHRGEYLLWVGCWAMQSNEMIEHYDSESPPEDSEVVWHVFPHIEVPIFYFKSLFKKLTGKLNLNEPLAKLNKDLENILRLEKGIELCEEP